MRNKKIILSSILFLILCASLIVGATFSLATSNSEVNIAIQSGNVSVNATITNLKTYSAQANAELTGYEEVEQPEGTFVNGGTAKIENGTLTLDRMIHGDKATFDIVLENKSNIDVQYQTIIQAVEDTGLFEGLNVTIDSKSYNGSVIQSDWASLKAADTQDTAVATWSCSVELPIDADSSYQNKSTKIAIGVNAVQGNAIVTAASINGVNYKSFSDAIAAAKSGDTVVVSDDALIVTMPATVADGVTIQNAKFNTPVVVGAAAATIDDGEPAEATADPVIFDSCTFSGNALLSVADRDVKLVNCEFIDTVIGGNATGDMPYVYQKSGESTVTVENTTANVTIKSAEKWVEMAAALRALEDQSYLTLKLGADLDFTGVTGYQISNLATTLDGQGYTISNLKNASLFGTIAETGVVKNLNLKDVSIEGELYMGGFLANTLNGKAEYCTVKNATANSTHKGFSGLVGFSGVTAVIDHCSVDNYTLTVTDTGDNGDKTGGLVGQSSGTTITNSSVSNITLNGVYKTKEWGGFVGRHANEGLIENCTATNVKINISEGVQSVGGFVGATGDATIKNCIAGGVTISVNNTRYSGWIGGFVGYTGGANWYIFEDCHVTGLSVTETCVSGEESAIGGFTGRTAFTTTIKNCSTEGVIDASDASIAYGLVGELIGQNYPRTEDEGGLNPVVENNTTNVTIK